MWPVPHSEQVHVPKPLEKLTFSDDTSDSDEEKGTMLIAIWSRLFLIGLTHGDLKNLDRDKNLSKKQAELLGYRLQVWNLLVQDTEIYFFHNRQNEFKEFLSQQNNLLFWKDVCSVIEALRHQHDPTEWHYSINKPWEVYLPPLSSRQWIKMTLDLCI